MDNELICGDSATVLKKFSENYFDLTITSPPYDNLRTYKGNSFDFEIIAKELYRVTKEGGVVVWIVGDSVIKGSETGTSFKQALYFKDIGFNLHDTMIFAKNGSSLPDPTRYNQAFQYMFIFSKSKPKTINLIKDTINKTNGKYRRKQSVRESDGKMYPRKSQLTGKFSVRRNIWKFNIGYMSSSVDKIAFKHPAIFPEKLAEDHIISWSNEGDIILDPFAGSGTTLKMAKKLNRKYVGIEISKEYCDIINERLK